MDRASSEQRREESTNFILEVLDSRHSVIETLRSNFTDAEVATSGYVANFTPPEELASFLGTSVNSDTAINTKVVRSSSEAHELGLVCLELIPADRLPLKMTADHGLTVLEQGNEVGVVPYSLFRKTLESIFADSARPDQLAVLSDATLLDMILILSPETQRDYHFQLEEVDRKINIRYSEKELGDDTVDSISIELLRPHACGANVGTMLSIRESLLDRTASQDPQQTRHISDVLAQFTPGQEKGDLTVEAILLEGDKNKRITLQTLTHYHMADIYDALHALQKGA